MWSIHSYFNWLHLDHNKPLKMYKKYSYFAFSSKKKDYLKNQEKAYGAFSYWALIISMALNLSASGAAGYRAAALKTGLILRLAASGAAGYWAAALKTGVAFLLAASGAARYRGTYWGELVPCHLTLQQRPSKRKDRNKR